MFLIHPFSSQTTLNFQQVLLIVPQNSSSLSLSFFILTATSLAHAVEQNTTHWLSIPGEDSGHFCPMHLGVRVAKEKTHSQALGETAPYSPREETEQIQLQ